MLYDRIPTGVLGGISKLIVFRVTKIYFMMWKACNFSVETTHGNLHYAVKSQYSFPTHV
jgi:hypothetical protein